MASYKDRMTKFQSMIGGKADLVFFPIGTDLDYLTGIHRDIPNYGATCIPVTGLKGCGSRPIANRS